MSALVDNFGRTINYLRLSVTDHCDLRCAYCMDEQMTLLPKQQVLNLEELATIGEAFTGLGMKRINVSLDSLDAQQFASINCGEQFIDYHSLKLNAENSHTLAPIISTKTAVPAKLYG